MYSAKTLDIQCKNTVHAFALLYRYTVQKYCTCIRTFIYKKKEHKSMIEKKKYILNKPKVP